MVGTAIAGYGLYVVSEILKSGLIYQGTRLFEIFKCVQSRAVCPHKLGVCGADDLAPGLLLKGSQNAVIEEGTSLHHYVLAERVGICTAYNLIKRIFYHAYGKSGGNILYACAVLLRLFYRAVHKDGAS